MFLDGFLDISLLNPLSFYFAILVMLAAFLAVSIFVANVRDYSPIVHNRFVVLDGLRGYLAVAVFIHHSAIWYFKLRDDSWNVPSLHLYTNLGQASVALFFYDYSFFIFC